MLVFSVWSVLEKFSWLVTCTTVKVPSAGSNSWSAGVSACSKFVSDAGTVRVCVMV